MSKHPTPEQGGQAKRRRSKFSVARVLHSPSHEINYISHRRLCRRYLAHTPLICTIAATFLSSLLWVGFIYVSGKMKRCLQNLARICISIFEVNFSPFTLKVWVSASWSQAETQLAGRRAQQTSRFLQKSASLAWQTRKWWCPRRFCILCEGNKNFMKIRWEWTALNRREGEGKRDARCFASLM